METDCDWWWAPLPEWLSAIATVVGVVLAYLGFNSWKVQYVAQKDYELAAQIVSNLYEIKRVLALIIVDGYKREYRLKLKTSVGELTRTLGVAQTLLDEDFSWALMELDGILGKFYFSVDGIADVEDEKQMPLGETFGKKLSDDVDAFETKVMGQIKPKLAVLRKTLYKPKLK